ncbi:MAG: aspartate carbamoyltransferase catalytic subunit [Chloroflexota bacterium]|nr:MAG: aspartate carbamoyltransferase catalytic subunit [Chloroflexota bacterium]
MTENRSPRRSAPEVSVPPALARATSFTSGERRHVLDLDDFSREEIEEVFSATDAMREVLGREIKKVPTLRGKTVVNLFYEASTRTRVSFELAAKNLSADVVNVSVSTSSVVKGESLIDTVRTLQALGGDMIVMRHSQAGAPYLVAQHVDGAVLNGGDGLHAHPTQALLDMYTVRQHLGQLAGRKLVIVGDILHSRVARSNAWGFTRMGAEVVFCGPPTLLPPGLNVPTNDDPSWPDRGQVCLPPVSVEYDLDRALRDADVVMALRLQKERQQGGFLPSVREYVQLYQLNERRLALARPDVLVMHPGPMNEGVEISPAAARSACSVVEEQVSNGVAVRMALFYLLSGGRA